MALENDEQLQQQRLLAEQRQPAAALKMQEEIAELNKQIAFYDTEGKTQYHHTNPAQEKWSGWDWAGYHDMIATFYVLAATVAAPIRKERVALMQQLTTLAEHGPPYGKEVQIRQLHQAIGILDERIRFYTTDGNTPYHATNPTQQKWESWDWKIYGGFITKMYECAAAHAASMREERTALRAMLTRLESKPC